MLSVCVASGILFTNIYTSLVDAKSWGSNVPHSIEAAREYFKVVNPGNFFRVISPLNQLLGILALILCWKIAPSARLWLGLAFALYVLGDAFTFAYFYPRNEIIFKTAQLTDVDLLTKTVRDWQNMNWLRSLLVLAGLCCSLVALQKIFFGIH